MALVGCAVVDQYSDRAIVYNLEAEDALDQGLVLNVVRASDQKPMQFTSVQSISGVASASGTAGLNSIPVGPHSNATPKIATVTGTVSGGPTFTVPVLDTQEFYSGVMSPVSSDLFDFYIHEEFFREEIFRLFIETIAISKHDEGCSGARSHTLDCELVFVNNPGADIDFDLFQSLVDYLLEFGLTTEPISASSQKMSGNCSNNSAGAAGAAASSTSSGGQCQSPPPEFRFCFSFQRSADLPYIDRTPAAAVPPIA